MAKPILLKGMKVYKEDRVISAGSIKIEEDTILEVDCADSLKADQFADVFELPSNYTAVPGFIDLHIHGAAGADVMDGTKEALATMTKALPKEGTTSFLATTMTQEKAEIEQALLNAGYFIEDKLESGAAEILGIHLEGPFVNKNKAGAQPKQHIIDPDLALLQRWMELSQGSIRLVTLAPELPGGMEMVAFLKQHGIVASIGHSDATYDQVDEAIHAGCNHVTHLYNQMSALHHREPGVVGAAYLREELKAEIIADGVHSRPEMVKLAYRQKQGEGLILITDSMRAKCLKNGSYDLGGQAVKVADGMAVLADGTLAGSILKMGHAVKNIMAFTGCGLEDAIKMAAINPARQLGVYGRKGSIAAGKDADIVILDENLDVFMTICRGNIAYKRGGDE